MEGAALVVTVSPFAYIAITRLGLSSFIIDVRADMCPMSIARIAGQRTFNSVRCRSNLSCLDLGKGVLPKEPPIITVMRSKGRGESELLSFTPRLAAKADEPKNTNAGLSHHGITGMVNDMLSNRLIGCRRISVYEQAKSMNMTGFAIRQTDGECARTSKGLRSS